jgi:hypothetical protein
MRRVGDWRHTPPTCLSGCNVMLSAANLAVGLVRSTTLMALFTILAVAAACGEWGGRSAATCDRPVHSSRPDSATFRPFSFSLPTWRPLVSPPPRRWPPACRCAPTRTSTTHWTSSCEGRQRPWWRNWAPNSPGALGAVGGAQGRACRRQEGCARVSDAYPNHRTHFLTRAWPGRKHSDVRIDCGPAAAWLCGIPMGVLRPFTHRCLNRCTDLPRACGG